MPGKKQPVPWVEFTSWTAIILRTLGYWTACVDVVYIMGDYGLQRRKVVITGRVQGVGFRPTMVRLARHFTLTGCIWNDTRGVVLEIQGQVETLAEFLSQVQGPGLPPMARIHRLQTEDLAVVPGESDFVIRTSAAEGTALTQVTADLALCSQCRREMQDDRDFRYQYPFINCTHCGPRYSIVKTIPYDRPNTTMSVFTLCERCADQYRDVMDRRFHAQPVACPQCGPHAWLTDAQGAVLHDQSRPAIAAAAQLLHAGKIVAVKGVGGFHLAVDATNESAVERLRRRKRRDAKPFAVMASSLDTIKQQAFVDLWAEDVLRSPESPIVLLLQRPGHRLAPSVAQGVHTFGFMLCYAPLHVLLFDEGPELLVMTSANLSDEPLICKNEEALHKLGEVADAFLMHNREIYRQVDDSIVHQIERGAVVLRRARGWVPTPIYLESHAGPDILALGADLKNTFCLVKQGRLICSEHIGDLADAEVYRHYRESIDHLRQLFEVDPLVVACDLHPGYFSTQFARSLGVHTIVEVQHHWAHVASCLAEHQIDHKVIGIVADGTGYGTDGAIWGGECLIADLTRFERGGHLDYFQLPGGDHASREAIRPLLSLLCETYGPDLDLAQWQDVLEAIEPDPQKQRIILAQLQARLNCVPTSSVGRVFDAVAALCGVGSVNRFDAQLPMALESLIQEDTGPTYPYRWKMGPEGAMLLDWRPMIRAVVEDCRARKNPARMATSFHLTWVHAYADWARQARDKTGIETVVLSGGVFCNRFLLTHLIVHLRQLDFQVYYNQQIPSNDGGIAVGQAAIASRTSG